MTDAKEREAFEEWAAKNCNVVGRTYFDQRLYSNGYIAAAWEAWQARAALAMPNTSTVRLLDAASMDVLERILITAKTLASQGKPQVITLKADAYRLIMQALRVRKEAS